MRPTAEDSDLLAGVDAVEISEDAKQVAAENVAHRRAEYCHGVKNAQIQWRHSSGEILVKVSHTCNTTAPIVIVIIKTFYATAKIVKIHNFSNAPPP